MNFHLGDNLAIRKLLHSKTIANFKLPVDNFQHKHLSRAIYRYYQSIVLQYTNKLNFCPMLNKMIFQEKV